MAGIPHSPSLDTISTEGSLSLELKSSDRRRLSLPGSSSSDLNSPFSRLREDGDKQKLFKPKGKHNLAAFGAKLSSTAASVGAHATKYKQRDNAMHIDHVSDMGGLPSPGINSVQPPSSSSMLKSKMFKQSRSDLMSLKIKTDLGLQSSRSSLSERSPMARGGSAKELDRIAAIGLPQSPSQGADHPFNNSSGSAAHYYYLHHSHHPHISFRKRDSPAAVLSSSSSNSILTNEGALYTFNSSNAGSIGLTSIHSFKTLEEGISFLQNSWTLLTLRIQPVFKKEEDMRIPVEDVNILILMHFSAHHSLGGSSTDVLKKLEELLVAGMKTSSVVPLHPSVKEVALSWKLFHKDMLITLEAIFLPLQLEFDGIGQVLTNYKDAQEYWYPSGSNSAFSRAMARKSQKLSVRRKILTTYRDIVIVPTLQQLKKKINDPKDMDMKNPSYKNLLIQCFMTLHLLRTNDAIQETIDDVLDAVKAAK